MGYFQIFHLIFFRFSLVIFLFFGKTYQYHKEYKLIFVKIIFV
jgi:hypothetical protein